MARYGVMAEKAERTSESTEGAGAEFQGADRGQADARRPHHLQLEELRERVPPARNGQANGRPGAGERPEVEELVRTVLEVGGREIVERLEAREAEIAAAECNQPELGRLVEAYHVPLLLTALALDDAEFDVEYPGKNPVTSEQRAELAEAIRQHAWKCPRCSLKFVCDQEWDEHVNKVLARSFRRFQMRV